MGEPAFKPRPRVVPEPQAPKPMEAQPVANNDSGWTEEEEQFFAQGEKMVKAGEAELARRAEVAKYNAAQAKLKEHEARKK